MYSATWKIISYCYIGNQNNKVVLNKKLIQIKQLLILNLIIMFPFIRYTKNIIVIIIIVFVLSVILVKANNSKFFLYSYIRLLFYLDNYYCFSIDHYYIYYHRYFSILYIINNILPSFY